MDRNEKTAVGRREEIVTRVYVVLYCLQSAIQTRAGHLYRSLI